MTFIVFVDPLRKKLVWALSDFVKIQKIFEPLKRLLGTALSYFHPPLHHPTHFCVVRFRRAGQLTHARRCLPALRKNVNSRGDKPNESQESRSKGQDCC